MEQTPRHLDALVERITTFATGIRRAPYGNDVNYLMWLQERYNEAGKLFGRAAQAFRQVGYQGEAEEANRMLQLASNDHRIQDVIDLMNVGHGNNSHMEGFIADLQAKRRTGTLSQADILIMADWLDESDATRLAEALRNVGPNDVERVVTRIVGDRW